MRKAKSLSTPAELEWDKRRVDSYEVYAPEKERAAFASTGCVLTDQIFEAARAKGIMPVDVIGPAPVYEDFD